ncbi:DNA-directed RNA polymerase III subunit rpc6 [Phlyctema vagabunda]|uniref:DNA-directed RNA polymerase III subunit RPC6 n=1 Tax=Phlyctema vagabunda TaxID=108571 RepID=A0ABR4PFT3_9HELO
MASSSAAPALATKASPENDIEGLKKALYTACSTSPVAHKGFRQQDLLELEIIPDDDVNLMLQVAQGLVNEKLLWIFHDSDGIGWHVRAREDANKYRGLTTEQEMVYQLIDNASTDGIWSKTIKAKTQLHDAVFRACIKHLETKNMISDMRSVEHPSRKLYIKSSIRPSERSTGGSWYTDNELDEEFVSMLMDVLYNYISAKSFYRASSSSIRKEPRKVKRVSAEEVKALRDKSLSRPEPAEPEEYAAARREYNRLLPMPPGYQSYPSLPELTLFIENSPITSVTLPATDIQQLLEILMFDNRIEQVVAGPEGVAYKAVRKSFRETELEMQGEVGGGSNGLTEAPCGRCPVFDLCEEGGPVGPSNCEYFKEWLDL